MAIATGRMTLEKFLKLPETKPASEYIEGEIIQKPLRRAILAFLPNQQPQFCEGSDVLPVPEMIPLNITAGQVFSWLRMQQ